MKKRRIGKTSLLVSEIGFGGASIGNLYAPCNEKMADETIATCFDAGINYFDTAPEYGHGLSERRLGDALRTKNKADYILSTKVGDVLTANPSIPLPASKFVHPLPFHLHYDYSYDAIMRGFEASLQRLGLEKVDLLFVHDLDPEIHTEKSFETHFKTFVESGYKALEELRKAKTISAIGLGVKKWEVCAKAMQYGEYDCFMLQGNYTLLEHHALDFFLDHCSKEHVSVLIAGPYASGILATGVTKTARFNHITATPAIKKQVKKIQSVCAAFNVPLQAAAIQFPLKHNAVASVVIGTASPERVKKNQEYAAIKIPDTLWDALKAEDLIPDHAPV